MQTQAREALQAYCKLRKAGTRPSIGSLVAALKACCVMRDLQAGERIHAEALNTGEASNVYVASTLVDMYAKCGRLVCARSVFDSISQPNAVSWNCLIMGYAQSGEEKEALRLYERMKQQANPPPNQVTLLAVLKAYAAISQKEEASMVDGKLVKETCLQRVKAFHFSIPHKMSISVANSLMEVYSKCRSITNAYQVFQSLPEKDIVSWNSIIKGYAEQGDGEFALELYQRMRDEGCRPTHVTVLAALKACSVLAEKEKIRLATGKTATSSLRQVKAVHSQATQAGYDTNLFVASSLVDVYAKCGSMADARRIFDGIKQPSLVSWNCIILGYVDCGEGRPALELYALMQKIEHVPNHITVLAALKACGCLAEKEEVAGSLEKCKHIHSQAVKSGEAGNIFVANTLVDVYFKCRSPLDAREVFDNMVHRNSISWNCIIMGYVQLGEVEQALQLYTRMQDEGYLPNSVTILAGLKISVCLAGKEEPVVVNGQVVKSRSLALTKAIHARAVVNNFGQDPFVVSALVDSYAKCGSMVEASKVFEIMKQKEVVAWTAMILGYADSGEGELALKLYTAMWEEGCPRNSVTYHAVLKACSNMADLDSGKKLHRDVIAAGLENEIIVGNSLIDLYGKCGCMVEAEQVFLTMGRNKRDVATWGALIGGYARQGQSERVFELFDKMQEECVRPAEIVVLSVLTACSHAGLVDKGREYCDEMSWKHGLSPGIEHYNCVVDMLSRGNRLQDALELVKNMPMNANAITWTAILSGCKRWRNLDVARVAFDSLIRLDDKSSVAYVLMANVYASCGKLEESDRLQSTRRKLQARKKPGQSWWTDAAGIVHSFEAQIANTA